MYDNLNKVIDDYEGHTNIETEAWYAIGCKKARKILEQFEDDDWKTLFKELPSKQNEWLIN